MARSRKEVTAAILRSAWAAQVAAQESLPAEQCAPVPAACAPICSSDSTHTSEALQGPVTIQRGGAVAATNKVPKRSRSKSLECPPERPLKRRALAGNTAGSSSHSITPVVPSKPESSRPAGYDMVACTLHPEFYQRTGDCVIMVEHMLFRLSRDLLIDSSPVFAESLGPSQSGVISFLHLEGDTVEDFTALCWALTSEPDKAEQQHGTNVEESLRLGGLFTMATKYKIPRYRDWSRTMLLSCSQDILASWSLDSTMGILASAGGSPDKDAALEALMYDVLKTCMDEQPRHTLEFAKTLGLRQLQGYIYYQELLKMNGLSASPPPESAASDRGWTPAQMGVLFRGFWSISRYWDTLKTPPQLPGSARQDHDEVCVKKWKRMWRRGRALGLRGDKPAYSPLLALEGLVASVEEGTAEHCGCHFAAAAKEMRRTLLSALGDHFLGPSEMPKAVESGDSGQGVSSLSPSKVPKVVESGDGQDVSDDSVDNSDDESGDESSDNSDDESGDSSSDDSNERTGDCVIMVEHMLFRLSWDLLVDSSPVFAESLGPSQSGVISFLHLEGDSVEDFTALCWALTSKPDKAEQRHGTNVEESLRLVRLFTMATKYKIPRYRDWSRTMLLSCSQDILASWSLDSTVNILASAGGSPDKDAALEALMYDVLKTRMDEQPKHTLEFAKTLGLRQLQGYIYYQELLKMNSASASPPESAASDRGWTPAQMGVLFRGFWSISRYWDTLKTPPQLPGSAAGQDHDEVCVKKWKRMWRRGRALGLRGDKPAYSPLLALEGLVGSVEEGTAEHCGCHFAAAAKEVRRTLLSALGDHFLGPSEMPKAVISEDSGQGVSSLSPSKVPKVVESGDGQDVSDDSVDNSDGESADESSDNSSDDESGDSSSDDSSEDSGEEDSSGDDQD